MAALLHLAPPRGAANTATELNRLRALVHATLAQRGPRPRMLACHWQADANGRLSCHWDVEVPVIVPVPPG